MKVLLVIAVIGLGICAGIRLGVYETHQNKIDLVVDGNVVYSGPSWGFTYAPLNHNGKVIEIEIQGPSYFDFANKAEYLSENVQFINR